jgi:hypothetical protein
MKIVKTEKNRVQEINLRMQNELESFVKADENVEKHLQQRNSQCLTNQKYLKLDEQYSIDKHLGKPMFTDDQDLDYLKYRQNQI